MLENTTQLLKLIVVGIQVIAWALIIVSSILEMFFLTTMNAKWFTLGLKTFSELLPIDNPDFIDSLRKNKWTLREAHEQGTIIGRTSCFSFGSGYKMTFRIHPGNRKADVIIRMPWTFIFIFLFIVPFIPYFAYSGNISSVLALGAVLGFIFLMHYIQQKVILIDIRDAMRSRHDK